MSAARLAHDVLDADFVELGDQRRRDRRAGERRTTGPKLETLFAATLVNHVSAPERPLPRSYGAAPGLRAGVVVNVKA